MSRPMTATSHNDREQRNKKSGMKIVVTGTRGIPNIMGGVETHCEEVFPRVARMGYDVTVIRRTAYAKDSLTEYKGVKIVDLDTPNQMYFEAISHTFLAIFKAKALDADVVHLHAVGPALLTPLARLLGMKVVFTHHGPDYNREKWGKVARMILRLGERMGVTYANEVIVISETINDLVRQKYGRMDCHLIYNGVPTPSFTDAPEYFDELGIHAGKYVLGMCRFVQEKNLHHLVEAYARLKAEHRIAPDVQLVLAGDTDFENEYSLQLKQQAREAGVILTGFLKGDRLHALLTHAACFVLPSSHEGLPIALLEAMSYRLPVIASDIDANKEVKLPAASYFPVGDVAQLADRIERVFATGAHRVDYDMSRYNWDHIAEQMVDEVYAPLESAETVPVASSAR
jgi:glycosyltransferase involved in cell wall biosynthesis